MTIYYIAVTSWDGNNAYTFDYIRPFITKQKRDEALKKMKESPAYKRGDLWLYADEDEVEDAQKEAVEGTMYEQPDGTTFLDCQASFPKGMFNHEDKIKVIIVKED